jgi:hypothetical protein
MELLTELFLCLFEDTINEMSIGYLLQRKDINIILSPVPSMIHEQVQRMRETKKKRDEKSESETADQTEKNFTSSMADTDQELEERTFQEESFWMMRFFLMTHQRLIGFLMYF